MIKIADRLPAPFRPWYRAARPRSLTATYTPLFIGGAVALVDGVFNPLRFVLALFGALMLQVASNFINEYIDYTRGTDAQKVDGMGMVLSKGELSPAQVRLGAIVSVATGVIVGLILVVMSGPVLLLVGIVGVVVVITYTAGPFPLSYLGLGEVAVFFAMGPLMTFGTYYAVTGFSSVKAFLAGVPIAFTVAAILHANNMRDIEADKLANKRTLVVRFGMEGARTEFKVLIYGAYVALVALILSGATVWTTALGLITLPEGSWLVKVTTRTNKPESLHKAQGRTANLHLWLGMAITAGWLIFGLIEALRRQ